MTSFILDTLAYSETLKAGGFSEQQAVTQARALAEILDRQMATKADGMGSTHQARDPLALNWSTAQWLSLSSSRRSTRSNRRLI